MRTILAVGLGGFVGSIFRYLVSGWVQSLSGAGAFPLGTVAVNVLGCLVLGLLGGLSENLGLFGPTARAFLFLGIEGFGAHSRMHTAKILRLSQDLPMVIEVVDTPEKIQQFVDAVDHAIVEGLVTVEKVQIRFYRAGQPKSDANPPK